jgi:hypothetical protein
MTTEHDTPGARAYAEDVRRKPLDHTGRPRPTWAELDKVARWSWEKNPTPRDWSGLTGVSVSANTLSRTA